MIIIIATEKTNRGQNFKIKGDMLNIYQISIFHFFLDCNNIFTKGKKIIQLTLTREHSQRKHTFKRKTKI